MTRQIDRRSFVLLPLATLVALALTVALIARQDAPPAAAVGENSLTFPDPATADDTGSESSMHLDANGFPVVAYRALGAGGGQQIRLLHCNDVNCTGGDESIEAAFSTPFGVFTPSLSLDSAGNPIITFVHFGINVLHCNDAHCAGGDESLVTYGACCPSEARHVLASGDLPVVFFRHNGMQMLRCANTNCTTLTNDSTLLIQPANTSSYSFALDADGFPAVGYLAGGDLMLMHCNDQNCDPAVNGAESNFVVDNSLVGGTNVNFDTALVLDSGNPVLSYSHFDPSTLKVARCSDSNCAAGSVTIKFANTNTGAHSPGLVIDGDGFPVVSYYDSFGRTFVLHCNDAHCDGDDEANHLVLATGSNSPSTSSPPSIVLDPSGIPVVSLYNGGSGNDLGILHCGDANCSIPTLPTPTNTPPATNTPIPLTATNTATNTPVPPTVTHTPTNTPNPPTATHTHTNTPVPPTATHTPTSTPIPPTATHTPTNTPVPPTSTPVPPTNTPAPPTSTPVPPTRTSTPVATSTPPLTKTPPRGICGAADLNGDGKVNGRDVAAMIRAIFGGTRDSRFDLNGDGNVNGQDLKIVLKCAFSPEPPSDPTATPTPTQTSSRCANVNGDHRVDLRDVLIVLRRIGKPYIAKYDLNGDGRIDLHDVWIAARQFGRRC